MRSREKRKESWSWLREKLGALSAGMWPPRCDGCGGLHDGSSPLCTPCTDALWPALGGCPQCGMVYPESPSGRWRCGPCGSSPPPFSRARSAFVYGESMQRWTWRLKRSGLHMRLDALWDVLDAAGAGWDRADEPQWAVDIVVPVPLHRARARSRGYNQAALLAQAAGRAWDVPAVYDALERLRPTQVQSRLAPSERARNVAGAFVAQPRRVQGLRVLVIDDVYTTGATLGAVARALRRAGAADVGAFTVCRALRT